MEKHTALKIIAWISLAGLFFSGYLSYSEIFNKICALGTCSSVSGIPACVYGFFMYLILLIVSVIGLNSSK
jgi:uncharacterized membrane protein